MSSNLLRSIIRPSPISRIRKTSQKFFLTLGGNDNKVDGDSIIYMSDEEFLSEIVSDKLPRLTKKEIQALYKRKRSSISREQKLFKSVLNEIISLEVAENLMEKGLINALD